MKLSDILFYIGFTLWLVLGEVLLIFYESNKEAIMIFSVTTSILFLLMVALDLRGKGK